VPLSTRDLEVVGSYPADPLNSSEKIAKKLATVSHICLSMNPLKGNCDIRAKQKISFIYEMKRDEILLKPKVKDREIFR